MSGLLEGLGFEEAGQPEGHAVDEDQGVSECLDGLDEWAVCGFVDDPFWGASFFVKSEAFLHVAVFGAECGVEGGNEVDGAAGQGREVLGVLAFSAACAAENEGEVGGHGLEQGFGPGEQEGFGESDDASERVAS